MRSNSTFVDVTWKCAGRSGRRSIGVNRCHLALFVDPVLWFVDLGRGIADVVGELTVPFAGSKAPYEGFRCQNVFRFGWQCWCIAASTALHLATWPQIFSTCHTSTHVDDCALRLHQLVCSTHCAFNYWRPHLSSDCCIGLEQSAGVGLVVSVVASFPQQTENQTLCLVLQSWLTTSHCTDYYYVTSLFRLIVTCPCSLRT